MTTSAPAASAEGQPAQSKSSLLRSSAVMASGTLVSRILGFIRAALLVAAIGSAGGGVMAAFQTSNTLPNMVFNILAAGVLDAVLVPQIIRALRKKDGDVFVNRLLTAAGLILFVLTVVAMIAAPLLVFITAASFSAEIRALAIAFALVCLPQIFFYGIYNLLGEVLNARGVFGPYMWAPVLNNVVGIGGLVIFLYMWGSNPDILPIADFTTSQFWLLAGSSTLGVISQALVLLIPLRRAGIRLRPDFHFRNTDFGSISRVAGWTFATLMVSQVGIFSTSNLVAAADAWANEFQPSVEAISQASEVVVGNAAYATSFMIFMVPQSLIAVSLATAIFTRLTAAAASNNHREVADQFTLGVRSISTLTLLAAAILVAGAIPMMQMVLPRASTTVVEAYAWVLTAMLPGVASIGLILMAQRFFFAYENAKPTFYMGIVPTLLQVIVGWAFYFLFSPMWWVVGAALGETICRFTQGFIGLSMVSKNNSFVNSVMMIRSFLRTYAAAIATAVVGYGVMWMIGWHTAATSTLGKMSSSFLRLTLLALVCTVVYWLFLRLLSPAETSDVGRVVLARFPFLGRFERFFVTAESPHVAALTDSLENSDVSISSARTSEEAMSDSHFDDEQALADSDSLIVSASEAHIRPVTPDAASDSVDDDSVSVDADTVEAEASLASSTPTDSDAAAPKILPPVPQPPASSDEDSSSGVEETDADALAPVPASASGSVVAERAALIATATKTWLIAQSQRAKAGVEQARQRLVTARERQKEATSLPPVNASAVSWDSVDEGAEQHATPPSIQRRSLRAALQEEEVRKNAPERISGAHSSIPVLIFFVVFVLAAFWWAISTALAPVGVDLPSIDRFDAVSAQSAQLAQSGAGDTSSATSTAPKIVSANVLSWNDDGGDNENHAIKMIDGDPATEWHSRQFDDGFAPNSALAIVVKLEKSAPLSEVTLAMNEATSGGEISLLRYSDNPRGGDVLASSAMGSQTSLKPAEPVEVDAFVLRFGAVPQSVDGANWAWIYELGVK